MLELITDVLALPGLIWLIVAIGFAGIVRGFTGFGTALIFVPVAGIFLPPEQVVAVITLTGIVSMSALVPRAWGQADRKEVGVLAFAALLTVPVGIMLLRQLDQVTVRWMVTVIASVTLAALITGWRYSRKIDAKGLLGVGGVAGVVGGLTGLTGPIVIMFYLAGQGAVKTIRANTILFLAALDIVIVANLLLSGTIELGTLVLAIVLAVPYFTTTLIGQAAFDPSQEKFYRWAAYAVIGVAVLTGLPLWGV
ncbi:Sulfite exporter TauE/SafE [Roseovarius albus]|uniref:Probable membrane transporter protein n=1 Tax=Roseovarius albus TaxID=1247867 RepID=A0A1X6YAF8_9RHOB|nr:sulfite exporter TauE/SafE family protein [Roseovarius albus]SLN15415.1 Sulfite exporter TauE/SafE [Roseovarius albus]